MVIFRQQKNFGPNVIYFVLGTLVIVARLTYPLTKILLIVARLTYERLARARQISLPPLVGGFPGSWRGKWWVPRFLGGEMPQFPGSWLGFPGSWLGFASSWLGFPGSLLEFPGSWLEFPGSWGKPPGSKP